MTVDQFILQAAKAAGHKPKKAERTIKRLKTGGTPDFVRQHVIRVLKEQNPEPEAAVQSGRRVTSIKI